MSTQIVQQVENVCKKFETFTNNMTTKMMNIESVFRRPESDDLLGNYIRKGEGIKTFTTKKFSSEEAEGGSLVIPTLYNKIQSAMNKLSPMRQLASIEKISTNALDIIIEDGKFVSGWVTETENRIETDTPKLVQKRIHVHELYAQPQATKRLLDDSAIKIEDWLIDRLKDSFAQAENEAFINGTGIKQPFGILHEKSNIKVHGVGKKITPEILLFLINSLSEEYQANATFLMNRSTLSEIQGLKDETGRFILQPSMSDPLKQVLFGVPVVCCSNVPPIKDKANAIIIGDFKSAYKIVDREDITIMQDPYTNKPFIKFYAVKRVGGDITNPQALQIAQFG